MLECFYRQQIILESGTRERRRWLHLAGGKRKLYVDNDGDWEEDRKNEEHEDEKGEAFDWSKPILIEKGRDYVRA